MAAVKECEEIQGRLSDYLDGTLDSGRHRAVEDHLYLCPICLAEHDALADGIKAVASLPRVEPPPGFRGRVMARVREEAARPSLWKRTFLPLRIKLPLHATALVLLGVVAVYLHQKNGVPQSELFKSMPEEPRIAARGDLEERDARTVPPAASPRPLSRQMAESALPAGDASAGGLKMSEDERLEGMRLPSTLQSAQEKKAIVPSEGQNGLALQPDDWTESEASLRRSLDALLRRYGGRQIQLSGAVKKREKASSGKSQTVTILLPADQYERFKAEVAFLGRVQVTRVAPAETTATGQAELSIELSIPAGPLSR